MRLCVTMLSFVASAALIGCATTDVTPIVPIGTPYVDDQNPVYIPLGKELYGKVFENSLQVLCDYDYVIDDANRYAGTIETKPRSSPGVGLFLKPGSPDLYERLLSTSQSYRTRATIKIHPAEQGGYFIEVIVRKELEDLPSPSKSTIGAAIFRIDTNINRDFEVVDPSLADKGWIGKGRDSAIEQEIIRRLKKLM